MPKNTYTKTFAKGEVIFKQGSKGRCAYLIDHGRVEIVVDNNGAPTRFGILGIGEIFGEMSILDGSPRSASAVALDDCELIEIPKIKVMEFLWNELTTSAQAFSSPQWHKDALDATAQRLAEGKEEILDWNEAKQQLRNEFK